MQTFEWLNELSRSKPCRLPAGLVSLAVASWCGTAAAADDSPSFFARRVAPILEERCAICHNRDKTSGGLDLTSRTAFFSGGDSGAPVVPRKPDESLLLEMVSGSQPAMPKNAKPLSAEQLADLRRWIEQNADWPAEVKVKAGLWSLQPVVRPPAPQVNDAACIKAGAAYGESDEFAYKVVKHPVWGYDLHATALHVLGIDHTKLTYFHNGMERRLTDVHGHVIHEILS